ncbi:hypothetical protein KR018_001073 [Drosophila ironensis]|nr:hypothetical protein KR018_001073 [Drosophila ironensis]
MIPAIFTSKILLKLATFFVLLATLNLIGSTMPVAQVDASPVTFTDPRQNEGPRRFCTDFLAEEIHMVCNGQTLSLSDAFPNSFGNRNKRQDNVGPITYNCCTNRCSYSQLRQYCAYSSDNP